jgi:hypothetical protein
MQHNLEINFRLTVKTSKTVGFSVVITSMDSPHDNLSTFEIAIRK